MDSALSASGKQQRSQAQWLKWFTFVCLLAGASTFTQTAFGTDEPDAVPVEKDNPNKRICKRVSVTGTHFKQRVCMKRRQWDQVRAESRREMERRNLEAEAHITPQQ